MANFVFQFSTMGCPCALHLEAADPAAARRAYRYVVAECRRLDHKYSHYRQNSYLSHINQHAGEWLRMDRETADLLDLAATVYRLSDGAFDITSGALSRIWDMTRKHLPDQDEIAAALRQCGWHRVEWQRPWLRINTPGVKLSLGGLAKEYAADRCARLCRMAGVASGVVDLGGDLAIVGPHANGKPWLLGIKSPAATSRARASIELAAGGLATSGDYERALEIEGRRYSHIIDARTGLPVTGYASVSVVADSCLVAGAASTLAMLLGRGEGARFLNDLGLAFLCIDALGCIEQAGDACVGADQRVPERFG